MTGPDDDPGEDLDDPAGRSAASLVVTEPRIDELDASVELEALTREQHEARAARSRRALQTGRARTRRLWRVWGAGLVVFLLVVVGFVAKVWSSSEIRAVHDRTSSVRPSQIPAGTLATALTRAWHSSDRTAGGTSTYLDVVVTYSPHTVTGRDARTGEARWSYTRTDRRMCDVVVATGVAVAIYDHDGNCDEVTGLDAGTGARKWTRTFFEAGTDLTVAARNNLVFVRTPHSIHLFDAGGGLDYWYSPNVSDTPCTVGRAVLGSNGVLVSQNCSGKQTLTLEALFGSDKDGRPKPTWSIDLAGRSPLSADTITSALSADGTGIDVFGNTGKVTSTIALSGTAQPVTRPALGVQADQVELIPLAGRLVALGRSGAQVLWSRPDTGVPVEDGTSVLLAQAGQIAVVESQSGTAQQAVSVADASPEYGVVPIGTGVLLAGPQTSVYSGS